MSTDRYDFSKIGNLREDEKDFKDSDKKSEKDKDILGDPRKGYRIVQCCANCKFYFYQGARARRGYCKLPNMENVYKGASSKFDMDNIAEKEGWPPTHSTNVCDRHQFRSHYYSIERIEDWVNMKFNADGSRNFLQEELDGIPDTDN